MKSMKKRLSLTKLNKATKTYDIKTLGLCYCYCRGMKVPMNGTSLRVQSYYLLNSMLISARYIKYSENKLNILEKTTLLLKIYLLR